MIKIALSAANMGPSATEPDFDAWAAFVAEHIQEGTGLACEVDQAAFAGRGAIGEDRIEGAGDEGERETIRRYLAVDGWEAFCAEQTAAA